MTKRVGSGKKKLVIGGVIAGALVLVVFLIVLLNGANTKKTDPYITNNPGSESSNSSNGSDAATQPSKDDTAAPQPDNSSASNPTLDPQKVATIDITPLGLTVSYVKGVGGFEYQVLRTPNGTRYAELSSPDLAGTKCTNDTGVFASIIVNPAANDNSTITKTVKIDNDTYGLSLANDTCTSNPDKLKAYQQSFSDAFSLLKKTS